MGLYLHVYLPQPWEPQCFLHDFHQDMISGDSWGDKVIVATSAEAFVLEG